MRSRVVRGVMSTVWIVSAPARKSATGTTGYQPVPSSSVERGWGRLAISR